MCVYVYKLSTSQRTLNLNLSRSCGRKERVSKVLNLRQEDCRAIGDEGNNIGKSKFAQRYGGVVASNELNLGITVTPIFPAESGDRAAAVQPIPTFEEMFADNNERILKPIGDLYPPGSELKEIADVISRVKHENEKYDRVFRVCLRTRRRRTVWRDENKSARI